jgi:hypothetical protein
VPGFASSPRTQPTGHGSLPHAPGRKAGWASAWRPGPARERSTCQRGITRAGHARGVITARGRGMVAWCPSVARWPRWKATAGVSTDVERRSCRARSHGWGLTGGCATVGVAERPRCISGRRRRKSGRWPALPQGMPAALRG